MLRLGLLMLLLLLVAKRRRYLRSTWLVWVLLLRVHERDLLTARSLRIVLSCGVMLWLWTAASCLV